MALGQIVTFIMMNKCVKFEDIIWNDNIYGSYIMGKVTVFDDNDDDAFAAAAQYQDDDKTSIF